MMAESNNLDWKIYESITKYIYEMLGKKDGVTVKGFGSNCRVVGKSGTKYQIDVLTSHTDGIRNYETAIECKYWDKKVTREVVMKLSATMEDTGIEKGVIVSKNGFTKDGTAFAQYKNIGLVELREADEKNLDGKSRNMHIADLNIQISAFVRRPEILSVSINDAQKIDIQHEFDYFKYTLRLKNGGDIPLINYVNNFRKKINEKNKELEIINEHNDVSGGVLVNRETKLSINADQLTLIGQLREIDLSKNLKITLVDQVWLIMKSIFEKRTFSFSENGVIIEHKKIA